MNPEAVPKPVKTTTDRLFELGLVIKGIDAVFEVVGGILLFTPMRVGGWLEFLALRSKHDFTAHLWQHAAAKIELATIASALYLLVHGGAKVILIAAVFKEKVWGYLGLMGVLSFFASFELYKAISKHELAVFVFCLFDALVVYLIAKEYRVRFGRKAV